LGIYKINQPSFPVRGQSISYTDRDAVYVGPQQLELFGPNQKSDVLGNFRTVLDGPASIEQKMGVFNTLLNNVHEDGPISIESKELLLEYLLKSVL
jgi:hypothetical protein